MSEIAQSPNETLLRLSNALKSLATDRAKNRANVLKSNIDLTQSNQNVENNIMPLSEAKKNK